MTAPRRVLSDEISRNIGGGRVVAAVFTTYSFDPEFFELEVLPLLFGNRSGFSQVEKVRRLQLEDCLRSGAEVEVFYDRAGLVGNAGPASLDFRRIDVGRRSGVFHPKLVLVLVEQPAAGAHRPPSQKLVVATLSANLTRAGWWENLEAGHVELIDSVSPASQRCTFRQDLLNTLDYLANSVPLDDRQGALRAIREFVSERVPKREMRRSSYRNRYYTRLFAGQASLSAWLRERLGGVGWNLEILSPFFDARGATALNQLIAATNPAEIRVLLPTEADGTPAITKEQYESVASIAHCKWSRLPRILAQRTRATGSDQPAPRRVHAKVYRYWRQGKGDVSLVGSVNLTQPAHSAMEAGNLEAAFFADTVRHRGSGDWWLQPLNSPPGRFFDDLSSEDSLSERVGLAFSLRYDWDRHHFEYRLEEALSGQIELMTIAGEKLTTLVSTQLGEWAQCNAGVADKARQLLKSTSLVKARMSSDSTDCVWHVLIREEGMTYKPSLLTKLTPDEILQYWSLLSESQRHSLLAGLGDHEALRTVLGSSKHPLALKTPTLFTQFAGIFHAFERLIDWTNESLEKGRQQDVTARLFGEKYDSVPVLLRKVRLEEKQDLEIAYVTFLSAKQALSKLQDEWPEYFSAHSSDLVKLNHQLVKGLAEIRSTVQVTGPRREQFLDWFEKLFLTHAGHLENGRDDTSETD